VTVCIATLFRWNYASKGQPDDLGVAALLATDRMITAGPAGDVEYEPQQSKVAYMTPKVILAVAGEYPVHTEAIATVGKQIEGKPDTSPQTVANLYGRAIQSIRQRQSEDIYLSPLGMNLDTFTAQQRDMSESFVHTITTQLQGFEGPSVDALVVGPGEGRVQIWSVDFRGTVRCFDDVGFHTIGIGSGHASLSLMQAGYTNTWLFPNSLAATYAAKKVAETAPGVGSSTDIHLVTRDAVTRLWQHAFDSLEETYRKYLKEHGELVQKSVNELHEKMQKAGSNAEKQQSTGEHSQADAGPSADAAKAARGDETGRKTGSKYVVED